MSSVTPLQPSVTLPSRAQTSLCSQFSRVTNREVCCIMPSCYLNDVQIRFVQGSLQDNIDLLSNGDKRKRDEEKTHGAGMSEMSQAFKKKKTQKHGMSCLKMSWMHHTDQQRC